MVTFVADGRTLPHLRVECDLASSVSDPKKQRYVHEFTSQCISDQLQDITLRLDSDYLLQNALTPVQPATRAVLPPCTMRDVTLTGPAPA